ncbi:MAG: hypothetical protein GX862_11145, partial [Leucobacter sp.]|nr:hypothetical protein [Leucobacter sp.]
ATLSLTADESKALADGSWGIVTYPGGGAKYGPFETFTSVTFGEPGSSTPSATVESITVADGKLNVKSTAKNMPTDIYAALIEKGTAANVSIGGGYAAFAYQPPRNAEGTAIFTLSAEKAKLDRTKQYELLIWKSHSGPNDPGSLYALVDVTVTEAKWNELLGSQTSDPVIPPVVPGAGSLTWGVSSGFYAYTTEPSRPAKGRVIPNGVGGGPGGYIYPQAVGSNWNSATRTGTVRYSGSVTFWGHGGAMEEVFANPVIAVNSPLSGSITVNGATYGLNLAAGSFTAHTDGSVTWGNVPITGGVSGGGNGGGGGFDLDNVTFTVGSPGSVSSPAVTTGQGPAEERTPAATPPATTGLTVVTPAADLVSGGEIEITASGFEPNGTGILVVIYSDPTVLDTNAKADANGVVRWIGKLPAGLTGKHTITLQGSINVGQEISIATLDAAKKAVVSSQSGATVEQQAAGIAAPADGSPAWLWWTAAIALLVVAGAATGLVVAQRRRAADAPTHL